MLHERYLICGCPSVSTSWIYRHKLREVEDGNTTFMEPGEIHRVAAKRKPSHFLALFVEQPVFLKYSREHGICGQPHFQVTEVRHAELLADLQGLACSLKQGGSDLELQSRLAIIFHSALRFAEAGPKDGKLESCGLARSLRTAREVIYDRLNENVTLEELASAAALSRFHLVRSFTARYGLPPHAFQVQARIRRACRFLRSGMSCAAAASAVGFADQSHLARHFRKVMGVTPRQYALALHWPSLFPEPTEGGMDAGGDSMNR